MRRLIRPTLAAFLAFRNALEKREYVLVRAGTLG